LLIKEGCPVDASKHKYSSSVSGLIVLIPRFDIYSTGIITGLLLINAEVKPVNPANAL